MYGCYQLLDFPPACTAAAALLGGGELSVWGAGRAEYRLRCTAETDARLLHGRLEVAVMDDMPAPPGDEEDEDAGGGERPGGAGRDGLCVGSCSVALAALVSRRGLRGRAALADSDGVHCGYVELCISWEPTAPAPAGGAAGPASAAAAAVVGGGGAPPAAAAAVGAANRARGEVGSQVVGPGPEPGRMPAKGAAAWMVDDTEDT